MVATPETHTDLEMMLSPGEWPQWPKLPMQKGHGSDHKVGTLIEDMMQARFAWIPGSSFLEKQSYNDPRIIWISKSVAPVEFKKIIDDGWMVD